MSERRLTDLELEEISLVTKGAVAHDGWLILKRAPDAEPTLRQAAWETLEKKARAIIERDPRKGFPQAIAEVFESPAGPILYAAYSHPLYRNASLSEVNAAVRKSDADTVLGHALSLIAEST